MIDGMRTCAKELIVVLEDKKDHQSINGCLEQLIKQVKLSWDAFCEGNIKVTIPNLPRPMYLFITQELTMIINEKDKQDKIIKELKLFLNTIDIILHPKMVDKLISKTKSGTRQKEKDGSRRED